MIRNVAWDVSKPLSPMRRNTFRNTVELPSFSLVSLGCRYAWMATTWLGTDDEP